jgi:hypothetical protein
VVGPEAGTAAQRLARLLSNSAALSAATSAMAVSVQMNLEPSAARRRVRLHLGLLGTAIVGMTTLFVYEQTAHSSPYAYAAYLLLFICHLGFACGDLLRQAIRQVRSTRSRSVRVGMWMTAAGCSCAVLYIGHKCAVLVSLFLNVRLSAARAGRSSPVGLPHVLGATAAVLAAVLICLGLTLPAVAYPIGRTRRRRWEMRSFTALGPFWQDLTRAVPHVVLPLSPRPDSASDWDFLLQRRVIEIDDAILALRPYRCRSVRESALRAVDPTTEPGAAAVEAAVISAALAAFGAGRPAEDVAPPASEACFRKDLRADAQWLLQVADAYARRPASGG